jgi:hypothetical protein
VSTVVVVVSDGLGLPEDDELLLHDDKAHIAKMHIAFNIL